jgi:hypothetical protein
MSSLQALQAFIDMPLAALLHEHATRDPLPHLLALLQSTARDVPAY